MNPWFNYTKGTLGTAMDNVTTSVTLSVGQGASFPDPTDGPYWVTIWDQATNPDPADDANAEVARVENKSGDVLTVARGEDGETAVAHGSGDTVAILSERRNLESAFWANVRSYGAHPTNTAATNTAAFQEAIDDLEAVGGGTLYVPNIGGATFNINAELTVQGAMNIVGERGASITQATTGVAVFNVTSGDVHIRGLKLIGPASSPQDVNGSAIIFEGVSAASRLTNISVTQCSMTTWEGAGIRARLCRNANFSDNEEITNCNYAGIITFGVDMFHIDRNYVHDIVGASGVTWGISMTRDETDTVSVQPRTSNGTCNDNVVTDVDNWEGISTHSGENITISGNTVYRCRSGISTATSDNDLAVETYAPLNISIVGNDLDSGGLTPLRQGITHHGTQSAKDVTPAEFATGCIVGNTVKGYGNDPSSEEPAIYVYSTNAVTITGNALEKPVSEGIGIGFHCVGLVVSGNSIVDVHSTTTSEAVGIKVYQFNCDGIISGNSFQAESVSDTHVFDKGIDIANDSTNAFTIGINYFGAGVTTKINDPGAGSSFLFETPGTINGDTTINGDLTVNGTVSGGLKGSKLWAPPTFSAGQSRNTTVTVTGAAMGDMAVAGWGAYSDTQGDTINAVVSAANTVTVVYTTAGSLGSPSATLNVTVFKP